MAQRRDKLVGYKIGWQKVEIIIELNLHLSFMHFSSYGTRFAISQIWRGNWNFIGAFSNACTYYRVDSILLGREKEIETFHFDGIRWWNVEKLAQIRCRNSKHSIHVVIHISSALSFRSLNRMVVCNNSVCCVCKSFIANLQIEYAYDNNSTCINVKHCTIPQEDKAMQANAI